MKKSLVVLLVLASAGVLFVGFLRHGEGGSGVADSTGATNVGAEPSHVSVPTSVEANTVEATALPSEHQRDDLRQAGGQAERIGVGSDVPRAVAELSESLVAGRTNGQSVLALAAELVELLDATHAQAGMGGSVVIPLHTVPGIKSGSLQIHPKTPDGAQVAEFSIRSSATSDYRSLDEDGSSDLTLAFSFGANQLNFCTSLVENKLSRSAEVVTALAGTGPHRVGGTFRFSRDEAIWQPLSLELSQNPDGTTKWFSSVGSDENRPAESTDNPIIQHLHVVLQSMGK